MRGQMYDVIRVHQGGFIYCNLKQAQSTRTLCKGEKRPPHRCPRIRRVHRKKDRQEPCAHSVQTYVASFPLPNAFRTPPARPELHLRHDDPRHHRPVQRPPLYAQIRRARPGRAERTCARARTTQGCSARGTVPTGRAHRTAAAGGQVHAHGGRRGGAGRRGARVVGDGHMRLVGVGAPRERAVFRDPLALRCRGELPARRDHQSVPARRHRGQPSLLIHCSRF